MTIAISLKIDVSKIDKTKLFKGNKGTYLDATVFVDDKDDQYGNNGMITQSVTKEEKQQGVKGAILGNCKIFWRDDNNQQQSGFQQQPQQQQSGFQQQSRPMDAAMQQNTANNQPPNFEPNDDIPF